MMKTACLIAVVMGSFGLGCASPLRSDTKRCCDSAGDPKCRVPQVASAEQRAEFRRQVREGADVLTAAFLVRSQLDGGEREDLGQAMAQRLDSSATAFLEAAHLSCASAQDVKAVVVMLPVEVVDDRPAAMRTLSRRLELLQEAGVERHRQYRDSAVDALKEALRIIERSGQ